MCAPSAISPTSTLVAMVTRVTQGHSGRPLQMYGIAWFAFAAIQVVATLRVLAEVLPDPGLWQALAAVGWLLALSLARLANAPGQASIALGGILASFGEQVAALHLARERGDTVLPECATLTFDYLRPAFAGTLMAIPNIVRAGRRITTVSVQLRHEGKLVCVGRFLFPVGEQKL